MAQHWQLHVTEIQLLLPKNVAFRWSETGKEEVEVEGVLLSDIFLVSLLKHAYQL